MEQKVYYSYTNDIQYRPILEGAVVKNRNMQIYIRGVLLTGAKFSLCSRHHEYPLDTIEVGIGTYITKFHKSSWTNRYFIKMYYEGRIYHSVTFFIVKTQAEEEKVAANLARGVNINNYNPAVISEAFSPGSVSIQL